MDAGEAEAIALALEIAAELLLMDEHLGREVARHFGLRYTGLIGVLLEAKRKGLIPAVKPHLDSLRDLAGFRVGDALYLRVLQDEGEDRLKRDGAPALRYNTTILHPPQLAADSVHTGVLLRKILHSAEFILSLTKGSVQHDTPDRRALPLR